MRYEYPLIEGKLVKRYKRFLADVETNSGTITIHCPNTGSMKGCAEPGSKVWYWDSVNPKRKYPYRWELVKNQSGHLIGINTNRANHLIKEAIENKVLTGFEYDEINTEVAYGDEKSRIDLQLIHNNKVTWIEVKNVTLLDTVDTTDANKNHEEGFFPDAITSRGTKHLRELIAQVKKGDRAVLIFCVQHSGIKSVRAARHIDSEYADTLKLAEKAGVEIIAAKTAINQKEITVIGDLPVLLD
jgi:sugar fermentation stimulation protein A